jgi:Na+-transporting NADH:ubiquinone oxidoreductase subunit NqrD
MSDKERSLTNRWCDNNPITLQMLGICSALAVTSSLQGGDW